MFKLFQKKERRYGFEAHPRILSFSKGLSREQKAAMAHTFLLVMQADGASLNLKMYDYIYDQFESIGFGLKSKYMEGYKTHDAHYTYAKINSLTTDQKKWFAMALHAMLYEIGIKPSYHHIYHYLNIGRETSNPYIK